MSPTEATKVAGSGGLTSRCSSHSRSTSKPAALEAGLGVAHRGEVLHIGHAAQVRREALVARAASSASFHSATLPSPPHWASNAPPGAQRREQPVEEPLVIEDPVEGRVGEHGFDRPLELQVEEVGDAGARPGRRTRRGSRARARSSTARRRRRSRCPLGSRSSRCRVTRPEPQPASSDGLVAAQVRRASTSRPHSS